MQSLNVSYSAFGKHTCAHIPSSEDMIKKIKTLQQLLQLLVFQILLLLPLPLFSYTRFLFSPFFRPFPLRTIQNMCWPCRENCFGGIVTN